MRISSPKLRALFLTGFLALALIGLAACDSDGGNGDDGTLEGQYGFAQLFFDADAGSGFDINVRDSLVLAETEFEVIGGSNEFFLFYQLQGEETRESISGEFRVGGGEVTFEVESGDSNDLFLPGDFTLSIEQDGAQLSGSEPVEVNIPGATLEGEINITLSRQGGAS